MLSANKTEWYVITKVVMLAGYHKKSQLIKLPTHSMNPNVVNVTNW